MRGLKLTIVVTIAVLAIAGSGIAITSVTSPFVTTASPETGVYLAPNSSAINVSETTTFDVTVADANGGIGAYDISVQLDDPGVGELSSVTLLGGLSGNTSNVQIGPGNQSVRIQAALMNTSDSGTVKIASIRVRGERVGHSNLSIHVDALSNESGQAYTVINQRGASLQVAKPAPQATGVNLTASTGTISANNTATVELIVEDVRDGVGAFQANLSISDPTVAEIVNAEVLTNGSARTRTASIGPGNATARIRAAVANTTDTGSVTIARIRVAPKSSGTTTVSATIGALYSEPGARYTISGVSNTAIDSNVSGGVGPTVSIESATTTPNATTSVNVSLSHAPNGLAGYKLNASLQNDTVADIIGASYPSSFGLTQTPNLSADNTTITVKATDISDTITPGDTNVTLVTLTVRGETPGTSNVTVTINQMDDDAGGFVNATSTPGTIEVARSCAPLDSSLSAPTDPDGDGDYEDVNGNGRFDFNDIVTFFENLTSATTGCHDFNGNGRIDFDDIVTLFGEI